MKVRFGVNTQVWVGGFATKDFPLVDKAAKMGFDHIEISYGEMSAPFSPQDLKKRLDDAGLTVGMCGYLSDDRDITSTDKAIRANAVKYFQGAAQTAEILGAKLFAGPLYAALFRGRWMTAEDRKAEWDRGVAGLKDVSAICKDHGLVIAVEPLNRFETDFLNTAEQAVRLCDEVDSSSCKIHLDTFHMNIEEKKIGTAIKSAKKHLVHFHTCGNDRGTPGEDHVPWQEVVDALKAIDYRGIVAIEGFAPYDVGLANGGRTWRPVAATQDDVAANGLKFLKSIFV